MTSRDSQQRILVAGASSGIGAALVRSLAADGHRVFACARRLEVLQTVTDGDTLARSRRCDVADEAQVVELFGWIGEQTEALDAVVVSAGSFGAIGPFEETPSEVWWSTIRDNVFSVYLLAKHALPLLRRGSHPRILTFAGGGAFGRFARYSAYATSKAGVVRLTECLADELSEEGIAVNAVAPGAVATDIHKATLAAGPWRAGTEHYDWTRRMLDKGGRPMSTAIDCLRFLLSEDAWGLTGRTISANHDPWWTPMFQNRLAEIMASDLYTMRRINIVNLPDSLLKDLLQAGRALKELVS